jgi:hypothetical protein
MLKNFRKRHVSWVVAICVGGALLGSVAGCSKSNAGVGHTVPVVGRVTFKGRPLTTGQVVFQPDAKKGNALPHEPRGGIDEEGNYELAINGAKGAPLGWYRVSVIATEPFNPAKPYVIPKTLIPLKYSDPKMSGFTLQVVENPATGAYDLKLHGN